MANLSRYTVATNHPTYFICSNGTVTNTSTTWTNISTGSVYDDVVTYGNGSLINGGEYELPDGSTLKIDQLGNYKIEDKNAQIRYLANRVRAFNPCLNASDLLEKFIDFMDKEFQITQEEMLQVPINAFIHWLIREAARRDGDPVDALPRIADALPPPMQQRLLGVQDEKDLEEKVDLCIA